jgi:hypothetical protein
MTTQPAYMLIGHEGAFRLPGGRKVYEAVMFNEATARSDRIRLASLDAADGRLHQVNRWVDWDQPIEVITDREDGA